MSKFVVLNIDEGSFEQGFSVSLGIGENGPTYYKEKIKIPPAPDIPRLYQDWQNRYRELGETIRQIEIPSTQVTNCSIVEDEKQARDIFENYLRHWFSQLAWEKLQVRIEGKTQQNELIRVIIDADNIYLKKLPWHLWELFHNRPYAEFALSAEYAPPTEALCCPIKILALFGGSKGLDLNPDRKLITDLSNRGAKVTWLEKPQLSELSDSLWGQHWDILFFAGHSSSEEECKTGEIQINDSESISLTLLRNALRVAVKNGLKLVIFNSCDGLGLADELIGVRVPQMIVMREPVPDEVARQFLKYFLEDFSQGHSLYLAVRNARQRLEWMEKKFPCASWLPVICQNPAAHPLIWSEPTISWKKIAVLTGILGTVILVLILGYRFFSQSNVTPPSTLSGSKKPLPTKPNLEENVNFSLGEKRLIAYNLNDDKDAGIKAFANKNFSQAIEYFKKSLAKKPNDPETLIYLNNAVARETSKIHRLPVPESLKSTLKVCSLKNSSQKVLKIAAPIPIDADSHIARDLLRGVAQAQNEINCQGGINSRLLQVVIVDDKDKLSLIKDLAQILVDTKEILAVAGHYSSSSTLEAGKIYDGKIVAVSPTSNAFRKSKINPNGLDFSKWVFRTSPGNTKGLVDYTVDVKGLKKVAVAYVPNRAWSESTYNEFKNYLALKGGEIVSQCKLNSNFIAEDCLEKSIKQKAEVMLLLPEINNNTFDKALQLFYANYRSAQKLFFLGGDTMYNTKVSRLGKFAENIVISMYWHRNEDNPSKFESDALALWKGHINGRTAMSYEATMVISEGLRRIGNNPNRSKLKKILSLPKFSAPGVAGKIEFESGENNIIAAGDRKVTPENKAQIRVLVKNQCETQTSGLNCGFVRVLPQERK